MMLQMRMRKFLGALWVLLSIALPVQAGPVALQGRDILGHAVAASDVNAVFLFDANLGLTWLRDANYAKTSGFDSDGAMTWGQAMAWAAGLSVGGFTGWQLPFMHDEGTPGCSSPAYFGADCGYTVAGTFGGSGLAWKSELGYLFYVELGNQAPYDSMGNFRGGSTGVDWGLVNTGDFLNMGVLDGYWFSIPDTSNPTLAWYFWNYSGYQGTIDIGMNRMRAIAIRYGDVLVTEVPEPGGMALVLVGLIAVTLTRRRLPN